MWVKGGYLFKSGETVEYFSLSIFFVHITMTQEEENKSKVNYIVDVFLSIWATSMLPLHFLHFPHWQKRRKRLERKYLNWRCVFIELSNLPALPLHLSTFNSLSSLCYITMTQEEENKLKKGEQPLCCRSTCPPACQVGSQTARCPFWQSCRWLFKTKSREDNLV